MCIKNYLRRSFIMQESFFFDVGEEPKLKIYSIVKRECRPKSLLERPASFSWPPRQKRSAVHDGGKNRDEGNAK